MKLSVIVATRNRAHAITACLDSIAAAFANAAHVDSEIVVVDNGSTDSTAYEIKTWARTSGAQVKSLYEPRPGKSRALNRALDAANGELLAFTDDDCRLHPEYVNDLLRHDASDREELVLRGGRIELGDPTDLPLTINTTPTRGRWSRAMNSARHDALTGKINGCNMAMRRALVDRIGGFDEDFGPGAKLISGDDTEFMYRAYVAGVPIEYVPDMAVFHHHGRKTAGSGYKLWCAYATGNGAFFTKYLFRHFNLFRPFLWDIKNAAIELRTGTNRFEACAEFSYVDKVRFQMRGALTYLFMLRRDGVPRIRETAKPDNSAV